MLAHAAAILDAGGTFDAYNRHDHAAAVVLSGDLSGFSHGHLALVAAILRRAGKDDAGIKPYRSLLRAHDPTHVTRAAIALAIADEIDLRLAPEATVSARVTKKAITVLAPLKPGRWTELLAARARPAFGRTVSVKMREEGA
jgi:exopolyphosphatase/pppGpp-phosphohydrolase